MSIIFCMGQGLWTANSTNLLMMRHRRRETFAIEKSLGCSRLRVLFTLANASLVFGEFLDFVNA